MQFIRTELSNAIRDLAERLVKELNQDRQILWLLSGGSNVGASVEIMNKIPSTLSQKLNLLLVDERYGPAGHRDSNWQQLLEAGFQLKQAAAWPVLNESLSFSDTEARYNDLAAECFQKSDIIIAQLGIGNDGHIAGILPESIAASEQQALVVGYEGGTYKRLTMSFPALQNCDAVYVFAYGESKAEALGKLHDQQLPWAEQPAQMLKQLPEAYIYNDQIGE
jgi:6-phosphogluconolactonase/glucosamine-6-phosphate isomerase/deaminase